MQTLYDLAGLAVVAYGEVLADGTSPNLNSGVATAHRGVGQYSITLPAGKLQSGTRDLMFVIPKKNVGSIDPVTGAYTPAAGASEPISCAVDDRDPANKLVAIYAGSPLATFADSEFSFLILRTIVTPPTGSPA